jgi:hypothetical protein
LHSSLHSWLQGWLSSWQHSWLSASTRSTLRSRVFWPSQCFRRLVLPLSREGVAGPLKTTVYLFSFQTHSFLAFGLPEESDR